MLSTETRNAIRRMTATVAAARTTDDVCEAALDYVASQLGVQRSAILLFDAAGVMRFRAWRGLSEAYRKAADGHSPWNRDTQAPSAIGVEDAVTHPMLGPMCPMVLAEGIRSLMFVPLHAGPRLIGKLMLYGDAPDPSVTERLQHAQDVADQLTIAIERQQAQEGLARANALSSALLEALPEAIAFVGPAGDLLYVNARMAALFDGTPDALTGRPVADIREAYDERFVDASAPPDPWEHERTQREPSMRELRHRDGRVFERHVLPLLVDGAVQGHLVVVREVTARRQLESQLLHMHKMESLGRLAGGIAHDFNNMLTAMIGYMDLVSGGLPEASDERAWLAQALEAAEQASVLTRRLLTFGRRQPVQPQPQCVNALIERLAPLLRHLVPESIEIVTRLDASPSVVLADPGELEQALVHLALNARDAMPSGGRLALTSGTRPASDDGARPVVVIDVADTGVGMDEDALQHVFEPFYTTKPEGVGTGLGLATAYAAVQQSGGSIEVTSAPGRGSSFRVLLPLVDAPVPESLPDAATHPTGNERVLLVEDDPSVRALVAAMLDRLGYSVAQAGRAEEALEHLAAHPEPVDLLVADMVMPGMSGRELAVRVQHLRPGVRVLLTSGYAPGVQGAAGSGFAFLPKPFSIDAVARAVRAVLDAPSTGA